jgi:hypothetical protein
MPIDHSYALAANPALFIAANKIALSEISANLGHIGLVVLNNMRCRLTLSQATGNGGVAVAGSVPMLRLCPGQGGNGLATIDAYYCHAGNGVGGWGVDVLPYVDIPINPGAHLPQFLFTTGMNGCALMVATAVPATAPAPLPLNHYRVLHDPRHHTLAHWHGAGYTIRFAAFADAAEPGPVPGAFAAHLNLQIYNPNNYDWHYLVHGLHGATMRVVTNFLHYDGAAWSFHSSHFHDRAGVPNDVDAPPGTIPALSSNISVVL